MGRLVTATVDVAYTPLATRLFKYYGLDPGDVAQLDSLPYRQRSFAPGESIIRRGDRIEHIILMVSGWAARARYTPSGARQIIHILLPGDLLTGEAFVVARIDHELVSMTRSVARLITRRDLRELFDQAPRISAALWWAAEQEDGMLREQIVRLGRRSALERTAHLILELHRRLLIVQQATEDALVLPITQSEISDVLGLSVVHIHRTLKCLQSSGLIDRRKSVIRLLDRDALARICDFDLSHFHLDSTISHLVMD